MPAAPPFDREKAMKALEWAIKLMGDCQGADAIKTVIAELDARAEKIKSLERDNKDQKAYIDNCNQMMHSDLIKLARARDILVEERAWRNFYMQNARNDALAEYGQALVEGHFFSEAQRELSQAFPEIGPWTEGDEPPRVTIISEAERDAIKYAIETLRDRAYYEDEPNRECIEKAEVLRSLIS